MNKKILLITCLFTTISHAMNENSSNEKFFSIVSGKTTINLTKGNITSASGKVDLMVVGKNQQRTLQKPGKLNDLQFAYRIENVINKNIYVRHADDESASDDDTYHPFTNPFYPDAPPFWKKAVIHNMENQVMLITEPRIHVTKYYEQDKQDEQDDNEDEKVEVYYYTAERPTKEINKYTCCREVGGKALEEASLDFIACYQTVLKEGRERYKKSIALDALSTQVGFPREIATPNAVGTILLFINNWPNAFDRIELFVKKRSDFEMYKNILQQYAHTK